MDAAIDPERQPLLATLDNNAGKTSHNYVSTPSITTACFDDLCGEVSNDDILIDFSPNGDPENPLDWPKAYKNVVVLLLAFMAFTVTFTCIGLVPVADRIILDLAGHEDKSAAVVLVTIWEMGEACGPLLIAPLSEIYGRRPVFLTTNTVFILATLLAATAPSTGILIAARFLSGIAVAGNVLNPAVMGDVFVPEARASGMALVMLAPLLGSAIGPAISGIVAETYGWRMVLWVALFLALVAQLAFWCMLRETYRVVLLKRRAERLRVETGNRSLRCAFDGEDGGKGVWGEVRAGLAMPLRIISRSRVLKILSLYGMLEFTFYYIMATTMPTFLRESYDLSPASIGYCFMAFTLGAILGVLFANATLDRIYLALARRAKRPPRPEDRLPLLLSAGALFPFVIVLYGLSVDNSLFTAAIDMYMSDHHESTPWPLPIFLVSVTSLGFLLVLVSISLSSYIVDAFGRYAASGMTSVLIVRCLGGTFIPMLVPWLVQRVGIGSGFVIMGLFCGCALPAPWAVWRRGPVWRAREDIEEISDS